MSAAADLVEVPGPWVAGAAAELRGVAAAIAEDPRLQGELVEDAVARLEAVERVHAAGERLADAGPASEIIERAPTEAAAAARLDRVILSRIADGRLAVEALYCEGAGHGTALLAQLREAVVRLEYPLVEAEVARRRRPQLVTAHDGARQAFGSVMRWEGYVVAPVVVEGRAIGFLHGDRPGHLRALDRDVLGAFAAAFATVFERAVLRRRLRIQRQELRQIASWADARTSALSDGAVDLAADRHGPEPEPALRPDARDAELRELLTRRELDVLDHMGRGATNADIARALVVSEGTVKFHVKNILRKLGASNRAEAASRYLRHAHRD